MKKFIVGILLEFIKSQEIKVKVKDTDGDGNPEIVIEMNGESVLTWELELPVGEGMKEILGSILKGKK